MESSWNDYASCWTHTFEANGWKLLIQESRKQGANILLEGRGNGSEWLGELTYSNNGVEKFLQFMERFEKGKK